MHRLHQVTRHIGGVTAVAAASCSSSSSSFTAIAASSSSRFGAQMRMMSSHAHDASSAAAKEDAEVRSTFHSNGVLTLSLHRPKSLNSLSLPMVRLLTSGLKQAKQQNKEKKGDAQKTNVVLVVGEGEKAFCAGGDIRALAFPTQPTDPSSFFREEYELNHMISVLPESSISYIAIMRGITMGGGVGISVHGKYRIITDNTMFAMPETGIGLFPDVGGTYFLPRLPGAIGMYLALTGQSLGAVDTMYTGIGTHFVPLAHIPELIQTLETTAAPVQVEATLNKYATQATEKPDAKLKSFLPQRRALIDRIFSVDRYAQVNENLKKEIEENKNEEEKAWVQSVQKQLSTKSPTSLLISFHCVKLGKNLTLAECLAYEFRVATRLSLEGTNGDFAEGVKSVLIDKKHKPVWKPWRTEKEIEKTYFSPLQKELGIQELKLTK